MPSFVCDTCQETLKKAKLDQHAQRCRRAVFSCIDCYKTFGSPAEYRAHVSCITEEQKYHGGKVKLQAQHQKNMATGQTQQQKNMADFDQNKGAVDGSTKKEINAEKVVLPKKETIVEVKKRKSSQKEAAEEQTIITSILGETPLSGKKLRDLLRKDRSMGKSEATRFLLEHLSFALDGNGRLVVSEEH